MPTRVLVVGAGAIGAFFGSRLATVPQLLVSAVCRSNYQTVKSNGFKVDSPWYGKYAFRPEYIFASSEEARQTMRKQALKWDYLLVTTKVLPEINDDSKLLEGLVDDRSSIVLIQNGLGIEEAYRRRFPNATILSGVTVVSATQSEPGIITHNRWTKTSLGPYLPGDASSHDDQNLATASERTRLFLELLKKAGLADAESYDHAGLQFVRWHKVAINSAINPSSVLTGGCGNRALAIDPELRIHLRGVMDEVFTAASKLQGRQTFPFDELKLAKPDQILASVEKNTSGSRPSMWHDWENGRRMELEAILGNPIRIARAEGLDMPRVQSLYALLRMAQERRNAAEDKSKL
jgi:2-dehydropantoate 2-reductase